MYYKILRIFIIYKSLLSVISWYWLLVIGYSKIWILPKAINLLAFPEVVYKKDLPLIKLFSLLPIHYKRWKFRSLYLRTSVFELKFLLWFWWRFHIPRDFSFYRIYFWPNFIKARLILFCHFYFGIFFFILKLFVQ